MMFLIVNNLLGEANKIFMIGVHVGQFTVNQQDKLFFALLFFLSNKRRYYTLCFFSQARIPVHLQRKKRKKKD